MQINAEYSKFCIQGENVQDLPIFSRILNNELSLSEYVINSGICKALGVYFAESNWRIDRSYLLKSLVLDNNNIADVDFA